MKMKNPAMAVLLAGSCFLLSSCRSTGEAVSADATVKQWLACVSIGQTNLQAALALMSFPFNWDGKILLRDETEEKLQDFRTQITAPGVTVTWYDWQEWPGEEIAKRLQSSKHFSKYQKSMDSIGRMVVVLSRFVRAEPAFDHVDGHYFGLNNSGKLTAWFD